MENLYMTLKDEGSDNEIKIYGDDQDIEIEYGFPEWGEAEEDGTQENLEPFFVFNGETYWLADFINLTIPEGIFGKAGFDGALAWTYFSGMLVKITYSVGEHVRVYTYCS